MSINSVNLTGRLTRDPDVRYTDGGTSIARFTLAVDRRFKQDGGPTADFPSCVDPDDNRFLAPESMIEEVKAACADTQQQVPATTGEVMQCVYNSLTQDYRRAVEKLQTLTGKTYTSLNIVGGGSQDAYLNQQTANATGLPVFAGPTEGTALGNLMVQFIHAGVFKDLAEARAAIKRSFEIKEYQPQ